MPEPQTPDTDSSTLEDTPPPSSDPIITTSSSETPPPAAPWKRLLTKKALVICSTVAGLALIGSSAYAYFAYFSPEKAVARALAKLSEVEQGSFKTEVRFETKSSASTSLPFPTEDSTPAASSQPFNILLTADTAFDRRDPNDIKQSITVNITTSKSGASAAEKVGLQGEARAFKDILYFKLNNITPADLGEWLAPALTPDQWVSLPLDELQETAQTFSSNEDSSKDTSLPTSLTPEQEEQIKALAQKHPLLLPVKKYPNETQGNVKLAHYGITLDKEALIAFVTEGSQVIGEKAWAEEELQEVRESLKRFDFDEGHLWINRQTKLPHQMTFRLTVTDSVTSQPSTADITLSFDGLNQPVAIERPADAKSLKTILEEIQTAAQAKYNSAKEVSQESFAQATQAALRQLKQNDPSLDIEKDSDGDGLQDALETNLLGTDPHETDTDGDGFPDGSEFFKGFNPLKAGE